MKCLDRYFISEFGKRFLLFFVILNAFLFCVDTYTYLEKFLTHHASFKEVFYYYMAQGVAYLPLLLPLTFLVTLVFTFLAMHRNNEIILLQSSGVNFFKMTRMWWLLGLIGSGMLLLNNFYWISNAQEYSNHYLESLEKNIPDKPSFLIKHLTLNTQNRLWYINRYDRDAACAFGIAIHEHDSRGMERRRIAAQSGYFDESIGAWILEQGREILFQSQKQIPDEVHTFDRRVFHELNDSPKLMLLLQAPLQILSLRQLKEIIDTDTQKEVSYRMRFWDILLSSMFCFFSCWIVLPLFFNAPRKALGYYY